MSTKNGKAIQAARALVEQRGGDLRHGDFPPDVRRVLDAAAGEIGEGGGPQDEVERHIVAVVAKYSHIVPAQDQRAITKREQEAKGKRVTVEAEFQRALDTRKQTADAHAEASKRRREFIHDVEFGTVRERLSRPLEEEMEHRGREVERLRARAIEADAALYVVRDRLDRAISEEVAAALIADRDWRLSRVEFHGMTREAYEEQMRRARLKLDPREPLPPAVGDGRPPTFSEAQVRSFTGGSR